MKEFDDLKGIWQSQSMQGLPDAAQIMQQVDAGRKQMGLSLRNSVLQLIPAFAVILAIALLIPFDSLVTYIGIVIILACIAVYALLILKHYYSLSRDYSMLKPSEYLIKMEEQYTIRNRFNAYGPPLYMIILFIGVCLYMITILKNVNPLYLYGGIFLVLVWFVFVYSVLNKRIIKRESERFETLLSQLRLLQNQMNDQP